MVRVSCLHRVLLLSSSPRWPGASLTLWMCLMFVCLCRRRPLLLSRLQLLLLMPYLHQMQAVPLVMLVLPHRV